MCLDVTDHKTIKSAITVLSYLQMANPDEDKGDAELQNNFCSFKRVIWLLTFV